MPRTPVELTLAAHDGCQKACTIYWKEAWLGKVNGPGAGVGTEGGAAKRTTKKFPVGVGSCTVPMPAGALMRRCPAL